MDYGYVKIKYRNEFRNHNEKFKSAITNLPTECTILGYEGFDPTGFEKGFETKDIITDFEARMAVFYSDVLDFGKIKPVPSVDEKLLGKAIIKLREIAMEIII